MGSVIRYPIALMFAAAITFALFFLMQALIAMGSGELEKKPPIKIAEITMPKREMELIREDRRPDKPDEPEQPPPDLPPPQLEFETPRAVVNVARVQVQANVDVGIGLGISDGEYLPIVRVPPVYPSRALSRGIEGHVIVEFAVTETGTVKDPFVVEAFDTNNNATTIFNSAALGAVLKFKYKPKVVNGQPVEVQGVQTMISFKISE